MPEVVIIISLAIALFLVLKNFPKTKSGGAVLTAKKEMPWERWFRGRNDSEAEITAAISKGQEKVVAPSDIDLAQQKFREENPEIARILYEADQALLKEDLREAEELALEVIAKDKKCAQAYVVVGKVAQLRGSFDDAKEAYKTAIKCDDELGEAYFGLGQIEYKDENYSEAIDNLQKAVMLERSDASWHAALGIAYMEVRQFAKAAKSLKRAAMLDMDNKEYKELASQAEDKQRSHSQAFRAR